MGCKEALMLFPDYLDGILDPEKQRGFEEHINGCAICRKLFESYRKAISIFQKTHLMEIPADISDRLRSFLSKHI